MTPLSRTTFRSFVEHAEMTDSLRAGHSGTEQVDVDRLMEGITERECGLDGRRHAQSAGLVAHTWPRVYREYVIFSPLNTITFSRSIAESTRATSSSESSLQKNAPMDAESAFRVEGRRCEANTVGDA